MSSPTSMSFEAATRPVGTLFGVPPVRSAPNGGIAVLGIPFDMGRHRHRIGSRSGPAHVRAHSLMVAEDLADLDNDILDDLGLGDLGDLDLRPAEESQAFELIEAAVASILRAGAVPLTLGGDGAVTLPQLRAVAAVHGPLSVFHADAHTDAYPIREGRPRYDNSNTFLHAVAEGVVDAATSWHIGLRPTDHLAGRGPVGSATDLGYQTITMPQIATTGIGPVVAAFRSSTAGRPVYVCWDMDVFDPSVAPGVVTPAWGGLTVREGLALLEAVAESRVVAYDINTVSPPHDVGGQTASLAAHVIGQLLRLVHAGRAGRAAESPTPS